MFLLLNDSSMFLNRFGQKNQLNEKRFPRNMISIGDTLREIKTKVFTQQGGASAGGKRMGWDWRRKRNS